MLFGQPLLSDSLKAFEFATNTTAFGFQPDFVDTFMGYYIAQERGLLIADGFLSNDRHYAIIGY